LLYAIASNIIKNHFRHKKGVLNFAISHSNLSEQDDPADTDIQQHEMHEKLLNILNAMPPKSKEVFLMNRIEKLTYQEIALRLGLSVKAIEKRMHEALVFIRKHLNYKI